MTKATKDTLYFFQGNMADSVWRDDVTCITPPVNYYIVNDSLFLLEKIVKGCQNEKATSLLYQIGISDMSLIV